MSKPHYPIQGRGAMHKMNSAMPLSSCEATGRAITIMDGKRTVIRKL